MNIMRDISVAVLGATGTVGQKLIALLAHHPWFRVREVVASERSAGHRYGDVAVWRETSALPSSVADLKIRTDSDDLNSPILFCGLDSAVAGAVEAEYAKRGHTVISNAQNHRMDSDVPLIVPEVNIDHMALCKNQKWAGHIITNPNCVAIPLTLALASLHREVGVTQISVVSLQAISGAGYPGVASLDIVGNIIPEIVGEEEKVEQEPQKIFGSLGDGKINNAQIAISAQCLRVPVRDGHTLALSVQCRRRVSPAEVSELIGNFHSALVDLELPTAPKQPVVLRMESNRPQVARDVDAHGGMAITVGRVRSCPMHDARMVVLGHNTVRGAAGAAIVNGEAYCALGYPY